MLSYVHNHCCRRFLSALGVSAHRTTSAPTARPRLTRRARAVARLQQLLRRAHARARSSQSSPRCLSHLVQLVVLLRPVHVGKASAALANRSCWPHWLAAAGRLLPCAAPPTGTGPPRSPQAQLLLVCDCWQAASSAAQMAGCSTSTRGRGASSPPWGALGAPSSRRGKPKAVHAAVKNKHRHSRSWS